MNDEARESKHIKMKPSIVRKARHKVIAQENARQMDGGWHRGKD